jgi:hypothetical protein
MGYGGRRTELIWIYVFMGISIYILVIFGDLGMYMSV